MGSFSWLRADKLGAHGNIYYDGEFKCLIPREFDETGVGFIKDRYQDYGYLGAKPDGSPKYDMYELLAIWNASMKYEDGVTVGEVLRGVDFAHPLKEIDEYTDHNRCIGIDIGCYDGQIAQLEKPLKLVSAEYTGTYEECKGRSYGDPEQGCRTTRRWYERNFQYDRDMSIIHLLDDAKVKGVSGLCVAALTEAGGVAAGKFVSEEAIRTYIDHHYPDVPRINSSVIGIEACLAVTVDALRSMPACKDITFDFKADRIGSCLYVNGESYSGLDIAKAVGEPGREENRKWLEKNCKWLMIATEEKQQSKPKKSSFERE